MYSPAIEKLINLFSKFPTVGPRTAARFVFYLLRTPKEKVEELIKSITELKEKIKICSLCFNVFETQSKEKEFCPICSDPKRDKSTICIVEKETDVEAIEKIKKYKGLYFVLGGVISGFEKKGVKEEIESRVNKLINRIKGETSFASASTKASTDAKALVDKSADKKASEVKEIILALNPTIEGEDTSLWLERKLKPLRQAQGKDLEVKISKLARGLPVGGELEYADEETLSFALKNRKEE